MKANKATMVATNEKKANKHKESGGKQKEGEQAKEERRLTKRKTNNAMKVVEGKINAQFSSLNNCMWSFR